MISTEKVIKITAQTNDGAYIIHSQYVTDRKLNKEFVNIHLRILNGTQKFDPRRTCVSRLPGARVQLPTEVKFLHTTQCS